MDRHTILLIDFNRSSRAFFTTVFGKSGVYDVTTAASPQEALDGLSDEAKAEFHLIILDLCFVTDASQTVLLQRIHAHPRAQIAELVVLSDEYSEEAEVLFRELGVLKVLPKQVGGAQLMQEVGLLMAAYEEGFQKKKILGAISQAIVSHRADEAAMLLATPEAQEVVAGNLSHAYLAAESLLLQNRVDEAYKILRSALKSQKAIGEIPTLRCLATYGKVLCKMKRFSQALKVFEKLSGRSPLNLMHAVLAGEVVLESGNAAEASQRFEAVLKVDGDHQDALVGLGKASLALGDTERALKELSKIRKPFESFSLASYFNNAGIAMVREHRLSEAKAFFERAMGFFQTYRYVIEFNLALANARLGNFVEAVRLLEAAKRGDMAGVLKGKKMMQLYTKLGPEKFLVEGKAGRLVRQIAAL